VAAPIVRAVSIATGSLSAISAWAALTNVVASDVHPFSAAIATKTAFGAKMIALMPVAVVQTLATAIAVGLDTVALGAATVTATVLGARTIALMPVAVVQPLAAAAAAATALAAVALGAAPIVRTASFAVAVDSIISAATALTALTLIGVAAVCGKIATRRLSNLESARRWTSATSRAP